MQNFQLSLFYNLKAFILASSFYRKYDLLFSSLNLKDIHNKRFRIGRRPYCRHAMIKAFIVKHLEEIKSIPKLIEFLDAHPVLTEMCGFKMGALPNESQFYRFLKKTPNSLLQRIHTQVNRELIKEGVLTLDTFLLDSKPVMAATKENNLKNPKHNSKDKSKKPKRNPGATLSYYSYQQLPGKKDYIFFWGYRTHVIVSKEGIPIVEKTLPNNKTDPQVAKKLIKKLKRLFHFKQGAIFIADAAYDVRDLYAFIVNTLKSQAFIPLNPRNQRPEKTFGSHGCPLCDAKLEMNSWGSWTEGLRERLKFRCPIKASSKFAQKFPSGCPVNHPRFLAGYGCTKYLDITNDARSKVPRNAPLFKKTYHL